MKIKTNTSVVIENDKVSLTITATSDGGFRIATHSSVGSDRAIVSLIESNVFNLSTAGNYNRFLEVTIKQIKE